MTSESASTTRPGAPSRPGDRSPWHTLLAVSVGSFMTILDTTVVNVAVHALQLHYAAPTSEVQWVVSGYALALGIATPLAGELGDRFGTKRVFLASLLAFAGASLLCGLAPTLGLLIAARVLQGLAGGFALPLGAARLFTAFPPERRGIAFGVFGLVLVFAPMIGPLVGGAFIDAHMTSWIFFVNVPIGVAGVLLGHRVLAPDEPPDPDRPGPDWLSLVVVCPAFGGLLLGAAQIGSGRTVLALLAFGIGAASFALLVVRQLSGRPGPFDFRLYRLRSYGIGSVINVFGQVPFFGTQYLLPLSIQVVHHASALDAGLAVLPMAVAAGATGLLGGRIRDRWGPRLPLTAGFLLLAAGIALLRARAGDPDPARLAVPLVIAGAGAGVVPPLTQVTALSDVPRAAITRGTALFQATQRACQALAVAVLSTITLRAVSAPTSSPVYPGQFADGLADAYGLAVLLSLCCAALALFLPGGRLDRRDDDQPPPVDA
jgi:DHA2 family multidrug resistance protein